MNILIHGNFFKIRKGRRPSPLIPDAQIQWWATSTQINSTLVQGNSWLNGITPSEAGWANGLTVGANPNGTNTQVIPNTGLYIPSQGGASDYIGAWRSSSTIKTGTKAFTSMIWFKSLAENTSYSATFNTPLFHFFNRGTYRGWSIALRQQTGRLRIVIYGSSSVGVDFTCSSTKNLVSDHAWHHVAITRSGTSIKIYIDGELVQTTSTASTANLDFTGPLCMASALNSPDADNAKNFKGWMDDARYYTRALSLEEIILIYQWGMEI